MVVASAVPVVASEYHFKFVPVADRFAIVAFPEYTCGDIAVGAGVVFTIIFTATLLEKPSTYTICFTEVVPVSATKIAPLF